MEILNKIRNLFTPYKWRTIWNHKAVGWVTEEGIRLYQSSMTAVVQVEDIRNKYRAYLTNGYIQSPVDINRLVVESPELKKVLAENGINI